jgi:hypothetical protein
MQQRVVGGQSSANVMGSPLREQIEAGGVISNWQAKWGVIMPRPQLHNDTLAPAVVPGHPHTRYIVVRQDAVWFIKFDGDEYGPYKTEGEAMLFAIDAAHDLGELGEDAQVLLMDENGNPLAAWTHGKDPYPPGALAFRSANPEPLC